MYDTKIGRPKKKRKFVRPKNSGNFAKSRKIAKIFANPENRIWPNFKPPKNRKSIPVKILICAPPPRFYDLTIFITFISIFRNGAVWASNRCLGRCSVTYGPGAYTITSGFFKHSCNGNVQSARQIGFWCDWDTGDGAVLMIGGGGSACNRADHGIGITEENAAKFGGSDGHEDFGNEADMQTVSGYSLNLWVK